MWLNTKNLSTSRDYIQMTTYVYSVRACFYHLLLETVYYVINTEPIYSALAILTCMHYAKLISLWHEND
jgi:hypothetical protein